MQTGRNYSEWRGSTVSSDLPFGPGNEGGPSLLRNEGQGEVKGLTKVSSVDFVLQTYRVSECCVMGSTGPELSCSE